MHVSSYSTAPPGMSLLFPSRTSRTFTGLYLPSMRMSTAWLYILLLLSDSIHLNSGTALLISSCQADMEHCITQATHVPTPADGHCLLHAVGSSIYNYLRLGVSVSNIITHTKQEIYSNAGYYCPFLITNIFLNVPLDQYFKFKVWNNDLGDIVLLAVANAFSIRNAVILPNNNPHYTIILPRSDSPLSPFIIVHLQHGHYSFTCQPIQQPVTATSTLPSKILPLTIALSSTLVTPSTSHCIASGSSATSTLCFNSINHVTLSAIKNQFHTLPTAITPSTTLATSAITPSANHQALSYAFSSNLSTNIAEISLSPYSHILQLENVLIDMR